jgi:hypothetical protein
LAETVLVFSAAGEMIGEVGDAYPSLFKFIPHTPGQLRDLLKKALRWMSFVLM